jgi:Secretion system C-terminal sorting domain
MENKFYTLIFCIFFAGLAPARAQGPAQWPVPDSSTCTAQFFVSSSGNTGYFRAVDSLTGVQDYWNFGDGSHIGFGNYVAVQHTYSGPGSYAVTHKIINTSTGCHDSSVQLVTIGAPPPPACSITFTYSHDSTQKNTAYRFYGAPVAGAAARDSVFWTINGTAAGTGDTLQKYLAKGVYTVCANLRTSLGCQSQSCQTIYVSDSIGGTPPPDSTYPTPPPPDSTYPTPPDSIHRIVPPDSVVNPGGPGNPPPDSTGPTPPDTTVNPGGPNIPDSSFMSSYPNPTSNQAWVDLKLDNPQTIYIRVYNSMGNQVEQQQVSGYAGNNHIPVSITGLQSGIYLIQLQYGNTLKKARIQKL